MEYEGWTNRATWLVNLWLSNTQAWYKIAVMETQEAKSISDVCQRLESMIDMMIGGEATPFVGDLINNTVGMVDWAEIGRDWAQEYNPSLLCAHKEGDTA